MTNKEIAGLFHELASLMELHDENAFKIRSYENAYLALRKLDIPLLEQNKDDWKKIPGIGIAIQDKLEELKQNNSIGALEEIRNKTPEGVRQMLKIKGLGPKKVKIFWQEMEMDNLGDLQLACIENRLIQRKGFGIKIQEDILQAINYFNAQQHLFLYSKLESIAQEFIKAFNQLNPKIKIETTGELRRAMPTLEKIEFIVDAESFTLPEQCNTTSDDSTLIQAVWQDNYPFIIYKSNASQYTFDLYKTTGGSPSFFKFTDNIKSSNSAQNEIELFQKANIKWISPECRDLSSFTHFAEDELIDASSIKGVVHNHSTYSDGMYSIEAMANECIRLGYSYLVMSDHSKSAFYANGLKEDALDRQWNEIENLNKKLSPFKIFKSIESDILSDGSLDYDDGILACFDLVIASIHSNLKMNEEKAMLRLIKAIENPYTNILGHPTGRILLSRKAYPVDHKKLIDACAANGVAIEINANPVRLDIDYTHIPYAMEKGVMISINPDAHNLLGIQDIRYGILAGRKGGLTNKYCLNSRNGDDFIGVLKQIKRLNKH